jgi:hypothetical protein
MPTQPMPKGWPLVPFVVVVVAAATAASCTGANDRPDPPRTAMTASSAAPASAAPAAASVASAAPSAAPGSLPGVAERRALSLLFPGGAPASCASVAEKDRVRCWIGARYEAHEKERALALALYDEIGDVAGTEREHHMEGGFRGTIHIVPELPVGPHERHLRWVLGAQRDIAAFMKAIEAKAQKPVRYRHAGLAWRFLRSVGLTTPSAYAAEWEVGYNVRGSLHGSADAVRETIFHEVFHLNDQEHSGWSRRALGAMVDGLMEKCGTQVACLKPYAPGKTMVRGGRTTRFNRTTVTPPTSTPPSSRRGTSSSTARCWTGSVMPRARSSAGRKRTPGRGRPCPKSSSAGSTSSPRASEAPAQIESKRRAAIA